jgi:hypothetical protein
MSKLFFLLITIFCSTFLNGVAQSKDSLVSIKGYYITRFVKDEIIFSYEQKIKQLRNESYSVPIDYKQLSFFIPIQIGDNFVYNENIFLNYIQGDSIFILPEDSHKGIFVKKVFNTNIIDFAKEICILSTAMRFSPYYEVVGKDNVLYLCTYIDGRALHKHIQEMRKADQDYLLDICFANKKTGREEFFFIVQIHNYTPFVNLPNLKIWLPYQE